MNASEPRPRRSCLYMPGSNARAIEKARSLDVDVLILDLEDSVAPDSKVDARERVCAAVAERWFGGREVIVRINALASVWGEADLEQVLSVAPDGVLVPKVMSADDIVEINARMTELDEAQTALWAMVETPAAILNLAEIAAQGAHTRLAALVVGPNDLLKEMQALASPDRLAILSALSTTVMAARANGLIAIDGVYNNFSDSTGLQAECQQGRLLGFEGKTLIHPAQIDTANRVFAPSAAELTQARAVIAAFALPENAAKGVIQVEGRMVELLHLELARKLVAVDDRINARSRA